jgi:starch synthase
MYIIHITPELAPVAKVGGLADVVFGLSREMEIRGHEVEIILPKYNNMWYDQIWGLHEVYRDLWVPWGGGSVPCTVFFGFVHGRKCFFIDAHSSESFFNRGAFYGFWDDNERFAFFSKAALEFLYKSNRRPDILHCHDWQTGLVPVMLYEIYQARGLDRQRVCFTIHNFRHQGLAGESILWKTGLDYPDRYFREERLQHHSGPGAINMMKGGIVYSNFVATVSPRHAWEARFTDQGFGLGQALHIHQDKFGGILNGVDFEHWNPETDPMIPVRFGRDSFEMKAENKRALRERFFLRDHDGPLFGFVGRLDSQKGVHLVRHTLFHAIAHGAQFVLLGTSPERGTAEYFWGLKGFMNDNEDSHLELAYSEQTAHLIYAGADIVVVPSMYEPCGLAQMIAMRYGAVPLVRAVGGLADTVFDWDHSPRPIEERNGFVFDHADHAGLESAMDRAIGLWYGRRDLFRQLALQAMGYDYSWNHPGQHYLNVYEAIRDK